jgi:hypothetical protein
MEICPLRLTVGARESLTVRVTHYVTSSQTADLCLTNRQHLTVQTVFKPLFISAQSKVRNLVPVWVTSHPSPSITFHSLPPSGLLSPEVQLEELYDQWVRYLLVKVYADWRVTYTPARGLNETSTKWQIMRADSTCSRRNYSTRHLFCKLGCNNAQLFKSQIYIHAIRSGAGVFVPQQRKPPWAFISNQNIRFTTHSIFVGFIQAI